MLRSGRELTQEQTMSGTDTQPPPPENLKHKLSSLMTSDTTDLQKKVVIKTKKRENKVSVIRKRDLCNKNGLLANKNPMKVL